MEHSHRTTPPLATWPALSLELPNPAAVAQLRRDWRGSHTDMRMAERMTLRVAARWQWLAGMDLYGEHLPDAIPDLKAPLYHVARECYRAGRGGAPLSETERAQFDAAIHQAWGGQLTTAIAAADRARTHAAEIREQAMMQATALDTAWITFGQRIQAPVAQWLDTWAPEQAAWRARLNLTPTPASTTLAYELLTGFLSRWAQRRH